MDAQLSAEVVRAWGDSIDGTATKVAEALAERGHPLTGDSTDLLKVFPPWGRGRARSDSPNASTGLPGRGAARLGPAALPLRWPYAF